MSKYEPLRRFLESVHTQEVRVTFDEIERILGFPLPESQRIRAWWSNNPSNNVMTKEWIAAGYQTAQVDIEGRKLVFRRVEPEKVRANASAATAPEARAGRHPIIGFLKGMITIRPGVDLTEPADPDWGAIAWGDAEEDAAKKELKG